MKMRILLRFKPQLRTLKHLIFLIPKLPLMYRSKVIIMDTPTHGNLGDHAIAIAEQQFVQEIYGEKSCCEFTAYDYDCLGRFLAKLIPMNQDILIQGGGSLGALWPVEEYRFRSILHTFSNRRIVVFPQTITFHMETDEGRGFFEDSKKAYEAHPDLTIFVREQKSYDFMKQYMPKVTCYMVPDIVTMLHMNISTTNRCGILQCLRSDLEKNLSDDELACIKKHIQNYLPNEDWISTDTVIGHSVRPRNRNKEVMNKMTEFSSATLVVTDRLHGMIFAALTGTPCIVLDNINGKVAAVYRWIKELPYIKFIMDIDDLPYILKSFDIKKKYSYDYSLVSDKFVCLEEKLKSL